MERAFIAVLIMALVTYIPRALPFVAFRKKIKSRFIKSFLQYVPYAVLGALTFPDVFYSTGNLATAVCGTVTALILAFLGKGLVVVAGGAIAVVFLTNFIF
ncbi:MAG: AzlD domain-containing protein [Lachnospiraceae bacterium]|nr:AzlD domain-containing protein [Lachnospiraceae bacterium]